MELLRPDFRAYLDEVRRTLIAVQAELSTAKALDDVACAQRVLCLMEAEADYLTAHQNQMAGEIDAIEATLRPRLDDPELAALREGLDEIAAHDWLERRAAIAARHALFQREIPALTRLAERGDAVAATALSALLDDETKRFDTVHALRTGHEALAATVAAGEADPAPIARLTPGALETYLHAAFPEESALQVVDLRNVPGGRSKETTMITLAGARTLPERIVMRSDIPGGLVPSRTVDEYDIVRIAARHGVPVPDPLLCENDASRLGMTFMLVAAVPGRTEGAYNPEVGGRVTDKPGVGRQLAGILARLHRIPLAEFRGTHVDRGEDLDALVRGTIESTYEQARSFDAPSRVHIEMAYAWLKANLHLAQDPDPCLIHCDVGLHNMLIEDGTITALLDWELATIASPAREIAKILHLIDYLMPREDFLAEYRAAGGPANATDPDRLNFYAVMNYMVTNQRARFANHLFFTGGRSNIVMANAGYDSCYRVTRLLSNALKAARARSAPSLETAP